MKFTQNKPINEKIESQLNIICKEILNNVNAFVHKKSYSCKNNKNNIMNNNNISSNNILTVKSEENMIDSYNYKIDIDNKINVDNENTFSNSENL